MELSQRARVRAGDHDEFGVLFEEHARAVYNHAFRLTGNWSAAEEVVSLTFLETWRLRGTVRPEGGSLLPWLLGIALNVARNISRAARRQQAAMSRLPKAPDVPDFADDLAGRLDDAERLEHLHAAMNTLRRTERDVLALCVWSGLNYAEAAEALGVPVGTVLAVGTHTSPPVPETAQPAHAATAAQLLAKIAAAAARQPTPVVRDSDFMYIRSDVAYEVDSISNGHETSTIAKPHERQIWLPVANICATGLLIENGERTPISPFPIVNGTVDRHPPAGNEPRPNFTCPSKGHLGDASYRLMQSIPTQQDALLAYLKAGKKWTNDDPPTEIGDMIREAIVPPALAAALYRLAATLPGATLVPHATNAAGRAGIGIMWTGTSAKQVYKNEWIFDKSTLQFIGERIFNPKMGQVTGESAILQQAFTAKAGQRP